jgi:hypothetical protein
MSYNLRPVCEQQVRAWNLNDQGPLGIMGLFGTDMLYPLAPVRTQEIEAQAVLGRINLINQFLSQARPLGRIYGALENGKLHPLPEIFAGLGHPSQPTLPLWFQG